MSSPAVARLGAFLALLPLAPLCAPALLAQGSGATTLAPLVQGLGVSGRVLVIAAHPDDEDTQLITWLARGRHVETAYLSLTRGDGGQNLIGNELSEALGAIRTEELLAARRLDGGRQYFTRAFDFGFSKDAGETLTQWVRDSILRDVVTVVRAFRPHVIVAVFSGTAADGHGHHQVSGLLAREAYDLAADTVRFPRAATAGFGGWEVQKFYRSAVFRMQDRATLRMNVGAFDAVAGRSFAEIAADSRSQHRSQGMGALQQRGVRFDQVLREATRAPAPADARQEQSLFDGVDTTWGRFAPLMETAAARAALDSLPAAFAAARRALDLLEPARVVPALVRVVHLLDGVCPPQPLTPCFDMARLMRETAGALQRGAIDRVDELVQLGAVHGDLASSWVVARLRANAALATALGLAVEATASREVWSIGDTVPVRVAVFNRGTLPVRLTRQVWRTGSAAVAARATAGPAGAPGADGGGRLLLADSASVDSVPLVLTRRSEPWWLAAPRHGASFSTPVLGVAEDDRAPAAWVESHFDVEGVVVRVLSPVVFRFADPVRGDTKRPIAAAPAIDVTLDREIAYAPANRPLERAIRVTVRSYASAARGIDIRLQLPEGLVADSVERRVSLPAPAAPQAPGGIAAALGFTGGAPSDVAATVTFRVHGRLAAGRHVVTAVATSGGDTYRSGHQAIAYDHITTQRLYREASLGIEAVEVQLPRVIRVAYVRGVGDNVAPMLEQLGVDVTVVEPAALMTTDLSRYTAVVVGPRAYEANDALATASARLLDYARDGGTLVVQYGQYEMTRPGMMPFPITLARPADRVTVEGAPVTIVDSTAAVLRTPHRITLRDFDGWVQDRSLYMPRAFDAAYAAPLEIHDPGEPDNRGALLVATLGRGTYVYTTLAFFRQLPNGVPGAARLFLNLLAARATPVQP